MADLLSTGVSGLRAFQRALDTTSHNIANAATPGYSRQRVELATRPPETFGGGFIGNGVDVSGVTRYYDQLLATQTRTAASSLSRLDIYASKSQALSDLFGDSSTGLSASLQKFVNSVQGVANSPTSTAARQVMLSEAEGLKQRLQTYDSRLGRAGYRNQFTAHGRSRDHHQRRRRASRASTGRSSWRRTRPARRPMTCWMSVTGCWANWPPM